jgi:hypothetical protein
MYDAARIRVCRRRRERDEREFSANLAKPAPSCACSVGGRACRLAVCSCARNPAPVSSAPPRLAVSAPTLQRRAMAPGCGLGFFDAVPASSSSEEEEEEEEEEEVAAPAPETAAPAPVPAAPTPPPAAAEGAHASACAGRRALTASTRRGRRGGRQAQARTRRLALPRRGRGSGRRYRVVHLHRVRCDRTHAPARR